MFDLIISTRSILLLTLEKKLDLRFRMSEPLVSSLLCPCGVEVAVEGVAAVELVGLAGVEGLAASSLVGVGGAWTLTFFASGETLVSPGERVRSAPLSLPWAAAAVEPVAP